MDEGVVGEGTTADPAGVEPSVERRCYAGESVRASTPLGAGWAAVTSHRVLAYNPAADGRRFEAVDRLNVAGVDVDAAGDQRLLYWGLRGLLYGLVAVGGGVVLRGMDLGETLSMEPGTTGAAPVGSVLAVTDALATALATLTTLSLLGGLALLVGGLALLGRYLRTRRPALVIERFGDEPLRLAAPRADGKRAARTLSEALGE
jgi:hypothetical protein